MKTSYDKKDYPEVAAHEVNPRLKSSDGSASLPLGEYEIGTLRWCPPVGDDGKRWQGFPLISDDLTPRFLSANQLKGMGFVRKQSKVLVETPFTHVPVITAAGKTIIVSKLEPVEVDKFGTDDLVTKMMPVFTLKGEK